MRQDVDAGQGLNLMFEILNSNTLVGESTEGPLRSSFVKESL